MHRLTAISLAPLLLASTIFASDAPVLLRPVHTYSIVARDPATGELGVAVQSHAFSVGSGVSCERGGVSLDLLTWHAR